MPRIFGPPLLLVVSVCAVAGVLAYTDTPFWPLGGLTTKPPVVTVSTIQAPVDDLPVPSGFPGEEQVPTGIFGTAMNAFSAILSGAPSLDVAETVPATETVLPEPAAAAETPTVRRGVGGGESCTIEGGVRRCRLGG